MTRNDAGSNPPIDLTTFAADAPLPSDPHHSIYRFELPEGAAQKYDPHRFANLELSVRQLTAKVQMQSQEIAMLKTRVSQ